MTYFVVETPAGDQEVNYPLVSVELGGVLAFRDEAGGPVRLLIAAHVWKLCTRMEGDL